MQKARKICCQITPRRIMAAILLAATTVNLVIVGAAFEVSFAVPTVTETQTIPPPTVPLSPTATMGNSPLATAETSTQRPTLTLTHTLTLTATSTFTDTPAPSPTPCIPMYAWPVYVVQENDWLLAIARKTASSIPELIRANCLLDTVIYPGQELRVPQLPTATPSSTPSITPTTSTNTPTAFDSPSVCVLGDKLTLSFSIRAIDPEGISAVMVTYDISGYQNQNRLFLQANGDFYNGEGSPEGQTPAGTITYSFIATDGQGVDTTFVVGNAELGSCLL